MDDRAGATWPVSHRLPPAPVRRPGRTLGGFDDRRDWEFPGSGETEVFTSLFGDGDGVIGDGNLDCLAGTYRVVLGYDSGWIGEEVGGLLDETFVLGD